MAFIRFETSARACAAGNQAVIPCIYCLPDGFWSFTPVKRRSSVLKRQCDRAGHCSALLRRHGNYAAVSFQAIARSELIAAFAGLPRVRIKLGAAIDTIRLMVGWSLDISLSGRSEERRVGKEC